MCKCSNKEKKQRQDYPNEYLKEFCYFKNVEPTCPSIWLPVVSFVLLVVLLVMPILEEKCCPCCCCVWLWVIYRIASAVILLLALVFLLKHLVPYWTKITEINDKHRERLTRMAEERLEGERLSKKTEIDIYERQARANIEEIIRDGESKRTIERMKQERQTHLADIALEIVKAYDPTKDPNAINQIIQNLK